MAPAEGSNTMRDPIQRDPMQRARGTSDRGLRAMVGVGTAILVVAALGIAQPVFAPLTFALFIIAIVWPLQERLQTRLPKLLALALSMLATVVVLGAFAWVITWELNRVGRYIIADIGRFQLLYNQMTDWLEGHGIVVESIWTEHFNVGWVLRLFQEITTRVNGTLSFSLVALIYVILGLMEVDDAARRLRAMKNQEAGRVLLAGGARTAAKFRRYLLVRSLMSVVTGILVWGFISPRTSARPGMGRDRLRPQLHPIHRPAGRNGSADTVRRRAVRRLAKCDPGLWMSEPDPVPCRQLPRASNSRQHSVDVTVHGAVRRLLLDLPLGHRRRVHRRSHRNRGPDHLRTACVEPLGGGAFRSPRRHAGLMGRRPAGNPRETTDDANSRPA